MLRIALILTAGILTGGIVVTAWIIWYFNKHNTPM